MCLGGSAVLARALVASIQESGGEVKIQIKPHRILVESGKVIGVETDSGDVFRARHFVASGLNPQQTFLELLDENDTPRQWRQKAQDYRYNLIAPLFSLNLNLDEPPHYWATEKNPQLNKAFMVIVGLEHLEQFPELVRHHEAGTFPPIIMWGSCPTLFDPSQAPPGKHTAFMWEKLPYRILGDAMKWDKEKEAHGRKMLELWTAYAPNLRHTVLNSFTQSPLDVERSFPNMAEGDLNVGAFSHNQIGYHRPFPGAGHYRGHLPGLYLCGACCHPGGNITGLPGYNSAQVILSDLGLPIPWAPPSAEECLKRLW